MKNLQSIKPYKSNEAKPVGQWNLRCLFLLLISFTCKFLFSQPIEAPSRLHYEHDWVDWKQAIRRPDTVHKLLMRDLPGLDTVKMKQFSQLNGIIVEDGYSVIEINV